VPDGSRAAFFVTVIAEKAITPWRAKKYSPSTTGSLHLHNVLLWSW
jgi:hypothetical protein